MIMNKWLCGFIGLVMVLSPMSGQVVKDDGANMMEMLKKLSDDSMQGRKAGVPGVEKAVAYVAGRFKEWGIEPAGENGTYFQNVPMKDLFLVKPGIRFAVDRGDGFMPFFSQERNGDWAVLDYSGSGRVEAEIVFAGFGLSVPEHGYDDYAGIDVKGKIVLFCSALPPLAYEKNIADSASVEKRLLDARRRGAAAVILFDMPVDIAKQFPIYFPHVRTTEEGYQKDLPVIGISQKILTYIFDDQKTEPGPLMKTLQDARKPASFAMGVRAALNVETEIVRGRTGVNVLGRIGGRDGKLKTEAVIVSAHMDGLGVGPDGRVMNGANDNASGTVVVMEMARLMKTSGFKPKRTIIFALWSGEEEGLVGSSYYAHHPLHPLEKTVAAFALDCVGVGERVQFGGVYYSADLWEYLKKNLDPSVVASLGLSGAGGGSDQQAFHAVNAPAFHFVTVGGDHGRIHHHGDDWETIDPGILAKTLDVATQAATILAQGPATLIAPGRESLIALRRQILVDTRAAGVPEVLARPDAGDYQDVDFQLAVLEGDKGMSGAENALALIKKAGQFAKDVRARKDLKVVSLENDLFYGGWRTKIILGLKNVGPLMVDPDALLPLIRSSFLFAVLEPDDVLAADRKLAGAGKAAIAALERAGLLVVFKGFDEAGIKEVLGGVSKPAVVVGSGVPSSELAGLVKTSGTVYGLEFGAGEKPGDYAARLKAAVEAVGAGQTAIWNAGDLSDPGVKAAYRELISLLAKEPWNAGPSDRINALTRDGVSGLLAGNFMNLLFQTRRASESR